MSFSSFQSENMRTSVLSEDEEERILTLVNQARSEVKNYKVVNIGGYRIQWPDRQRFRQSLLLIGGDFQALGEQVEDTEYFNYLKTIWRQEVLREEIRTKTEILEAIHFDKNILTTAPTTSEEFISTSSKLDLFVHVLGTTKKTANQLLVRTTKLLAEEQQRETSFLTETTVGTVTEEQLNVARFNVRVSALFKAAEREGSSITIEDENYLEDEVEELVTAVVKLTQRIEDMEIRASTALAGRSARMEAERINNQTTTEIPTSTPLPNPTTTRMIRKLTALNVQI